MVGLIFIFIIIIFILYIIVIIIFVTVVAGLVFTGDSENSLCNKLVV